MIALHAKWLKTNAVSGSKSNHWIFWYFLSYYFLHLFCCYSLGHWLLLSAEERLHFHYIYELGCYWWVISVQFSHKFLVQAREDGSILIFSKNLFLCLRRNRNVWIYCDVHENSIHHHIEPVKMLLRNIPAEEIRALITCKPVDEGQCMGEWGFAE